MNRLLVAISAYAGDQAQVDANLPVYQHHGVAVLVLSPEDAPITQLTGNPQGVYYNYAGYAQWAGPESLIRHKKFLQILLAAPYERYLFHDADSVCLSRLLPEYLWESDVLWSNEVPDTNTAPSQLPKIAMQPPYVFSRRILKLLVSFADKPATSYTSDATRDGFPLPTGCIDHYMLQIAHAAGVEHRTFPDGASWETTSEIGLREMARKVREDGTIFVHQVKSFNALHHLLGARSLYGKRR